MEEEEQQVHMLEFPLDDGSSARITVGPTDSLRDFQEKLLTSGLTLDMFDGENFDEDTNVLEFFATIGLTIGGNVETEASTIDDALDKSRDDGLSGLFCAVLGCASNKIDYPDIALFKFPLQKKRSLAWAKAICRPELADQSVAVLNDQFAVCANHFMPDQFARSDRKLLTRTAIPTVVKHDTEIEINRRSEEEAIAVQMSENIGTDLNEDVASDVNTTVHPGSLCRLCAKPMEGAPIFIFSSEGEKKKLAERINKCLPLVVKKTDPLPKQICHVCLLHLELQYSFVDTCLKAEEKLLELSQAFVVESMKASTGSKAKQKYCCPLCCSGGMRHVTNETGDQNRSSVAISSIKTETDAKEFSDLYSDDGDAEDPEPVIIEVDSSDYGPGPSTLYLMEDKLLLNFDCYICEETFNNAFVCMEHCKLHSAENYFPCVVCGVVFWSHERFKSHFMEHRTQIAAPKRASWRPLLECGTCNLQFITKKEFIIHKCPQPLLRTLNSDTWDLGCQVCCRSFKSMERAEAHRSIHEGADPLECSHCGFETETMACLEDHVVTAHATPALNNCPECHLQFHTPLHLEKHLKVHQSLYYQCSLCNNTFQDVDAINAHLETHTETVQPPKSGLQCSKCQQAFTDKAHLRHHLETMHDSMKRMPSLIQYQCKVCSERITTSAEVLIHRTVHWKSDDTSLPHLCEYCGQGHNNPNSLARHRRAVHPDEQPYVCTVCDMTTRTLYEARVHRKTHTGYVSPSPQKLETRIYQCDQCPSLFSERSSFVAHKKSHKSKGSKWFECESCEKTFPERHRLLVHKRQHTGEKPFSCGTCGKRFAQTSAMYTHALIHTGETPHSCDLCGRKFRIKSDRDNHRRFHTGEKPFKCEYCGKTFRTGQVYYQHRMIHTGERRFPCDICGRAFKRSHTLVCHRRIHTGEKPNVCDICGKGFRQRTDMRKHKINLHSVPA